MTKAPVRFEDKDFVYGMARTVDYRAQVHASYINSRLDAWFKNAVKVFGYGNGEFFTGTSSLPEPPTECAYLIGIEPISRGVTKDEIVEKLRQFELTMTLEMGFVGHPRDRQTSKIDLGMKELADRIEREGIKP